MCCSHQAVGSGRIQGEVGIIEPDGSKESAKALQGLLVGRMLVDFSKSVALARMMMNLTGQRCKLNKGTRVARCGLVVSVQIPRWKFLEIGPKQELPTHLQELYKQSISIQLG